MKKMIMAYKKPNDAKRLLDEGNERDGQYQKPKYHT